MSRQNEREISLLDLLIYILLRWRGIVVWTLVGVVFFSGYSYCNSLQTMKQQESMVENQMDRETALEELKSVLTTEQLSNVNRVLQYEAFEEYYNQSIVMKINPAEVSCSKVLYMVKGNSIEASKSIRQVYEDLVTAGFLQWLEENTTETVGAEMSELITVNEGNEMLVTTQEGEISSSISREFQESSSLETSVIHSSSEECKKLSSYLKKYIEEQKAVLSDKLGDNHELVYISESFELIADNELLKTQKNVLGSIESARKSAKTIKDEFSSVESRYYALCSVDETNDQEVPNDNIVVATVNIKQVVLGAVVFAFLYVFLLFVMYIMNARIRITDDMTSLLSIAQLGTIKKPFQTKGMFGKIDLWIYNLQNRNKRVFSEDEEIGLTISAIKIAVKKNDFANVLCLGTAWNEKASEIAEKMKASLLQEGISVQLVKNALYDQESLELLDGASGAFLLECADRTLYDEVQKELELLERQGIKCLGIVVAEV